MPPILNKDFEGLVLSINSLINVTKNHELQIKTVIEGQEIIQQKITNIIKFENLFYKQIKQVVLDGEHNINYLIKNHVEINKNLLCYTNDIIEKIEGIKKKEGTKITKKNILYIIMFCACMCLFFAYIFTNNVVSNQTVKDALRYRLMIKNAKPQVRERFEVLDSITNNFTITELEEKLYRTEGNKNRK